MQSVWKIWLGAAAALTTAYFVVDNTPTSKLVLYNGLGAMAVIMILVGVKMNQPKPREPWLWFAAGLGSFLIADVIYYVQELLLGADNVPYPSIADPFYLLVYPLLIIGLTKMLRELAPGRNKTSFIDAAIVGVAMFGVLWIIFVDTVWATEENTALALTIQLAAPILDVAVLAVATRVLVALHLQHPPIAFIVTGIGSLAIADVAYGYANATTVFHTGTWIDFFWLGFYVAFAAAALHPSAAAPATAQPNIGKLTVRQLAIMILATLAVPVIDLVWGTPEDRQVIILVSAVLVLLILSRVFGLMQALQRGQERLRHDAVHDALTGLANRVLFAERTELALETGNESGVAVLFIDLDDFKNVNDSLGHEAGDILLAEVAARLVRCVGPADMVARFGGDEFAVLLPEATSPYDASTMARRILDALEPPIDLSVRSVNVLASIGIAIDHEQNLDVDTILRNADVAMYLSKSRGKGRYEIFEAKMHEEAVERLDLKADLQRALEQEQFVVHYQPIFDLNTGQVTLAEALIRWKHPDKGLIGPDRFIPLAEENGMIVEIGEWVLREACMQAAQWQKIPGFHDMGITVNLSMRQLQDNELINALTRALKDSGLAARHLVLEITESMLALDAERSVGILEQLKTIGVKLAIDDFGTGYSSFSYLRSFPVDSIKIDRSFINELHRSSTSTALIEAIVNLSRALGAYTVAEGIEHGDQAGLLRRIGCDRGQGFYYCRPLSGPALTTLLRDHLEDEKEPLLAWRRSSEKVQGRIYDVDIRTGLTEIKDIDSELIELNDDLNVPLMGQWPWLKNWSESFDSWSPMMVGIRSAESGQLTAAAFFATIHRGESTAIVAMGNGSSLFTALQARTEEAAVSLAQGIAAALNDIPGAWSLDLEQVRDQDPTMLHLAEMLDHAQLLPELRVPRVIFSTSHNVDDVLSKSMRKQLRRSQNKISNAGLSMTLAFDRGRAITAELIDEVEAVHVSRDRAARRNSDLDRPAEREFWRRVVEGGHNEWEVEIATLRLDGNLAAYVVALLDGETYRVYDGRMNTEYQDFSPGRLVEAAALSRAMTDPRFAVLDWMSGIAAEKLLTTNIAEGRARLVATSGSRFVSFPKKSDFRKENSRI